MRIRLFGGLLIEHDGTALPLTGAMQLAVFFRLLVDAGTAVSYRAISEDVWGTDAPENTRAALQSIISRLRTQLPPGIVESTVGGYRARVRRSEVDALQFTDLVAAAAAADPVEAARLAGEALELWIGEPWIPSDHFDWFARDLAADRRTAVTLGGLSAPAPSATRTIPAPLTPLIGRAAEVEAIGRQLASNRLVTIVGTGGAGKTRLAIEVGSRRSSAVFVELASVGRDEVLGALLAATGREIRSPETSGDPGGARERVIEALVGRDILLVMDNCEHVIDSAATVARDLLQALPLLRVLTTSREPLGIPGEAFVVVGALAHPSDSDLGVLDAAGLRHSAAIELLDQRTAAARGAGIIDDELVTAARICLRLDGLPLAIELAAAKLRTLSFDEVLAGLEDRFTLLAGGFRAALPRHQTLRAMIDWSWSLLSVSEQRLLSHLAVFPAGIRVSDASAFAAVLGFTTSAPFESLVDRSLVQRAHGRYRSLETIREYGIERLTESGDLDAARLAQAKYLVEKTRDFDRRLRGPEIMDALSWFDDEDDNIIATLRYVIGVPLPELAIGLVISTAWYWGIRDRNEDALTWITAVAPLAQGVEGDEARILTLVEPFMSAISAAQFGDNNPDEAMRTASLKLVGLDVVVLGAGSNELLQLLSASLGEFARVALEPDWMLHVRLPDGADLGLDPWPTAVLNLVRGAMAQNRGDIELLGTVSTLAVHQFREIGDLWGLAISLQLHAEWLMVHGRLEEALAESDESISTLRRITSAGDLIQQQGLATQILLRLGRAEEAQARVAEMLTSARLDGNVRSLAQAEIAMLSLEVVNGDVAAAGLRVVEVDTLLASWRGVPPQVTAMVALAKSGLAILRGQRSEAEDFVRHAADAALASRDHPVIALVAVQVGTVALDRGDVAAAVRAVDVALAFRGAEDRTNLQVAAILAAAEEAGIVRDGTLVAERPRALEALRHLVGS